MVSPIGWYNLELLRGASTQSIKTTKKKHLLKVLEGVHFSMLQLRDNKEGLLHYLTVQAAQPTVP